MSNSERLAQLKKVSQSKDTNQAEMTGAERIASLRSATPVPGRPLSFTNQSQSNSRIVTEGTTFSEDRTSDDE